MTFLIAYIEIWSEGMLMKRPICEFRLMSVGWRDLSCSCFTKLRERVNTVAFIQHSLGFLLQKWSLSARAICLLQIFEMDCEGSLEGKLSLFNLQMWNLHQHLSVRLSKRLRCAVWQTPFILRRSMSERYWHIQCFIQTLFPIPALPGNG